MAIVAIILAFNLVYFVSGSVEMFPTGERQSGVREVTGTAAVALCLVEAVLWRLLQRVMQASS